MGGRRPTFPRVVAVSSALPGLTSLFGMGRGAPRRHSRHVSLNGLWRTKEGHGERIAPDSRNRHTRSRERDNSPGLAGRTGALLHAQAFGQLVPLGSTHRCASTCGLSTSSSATALRGGLISGRVSRLDAFSAYLNRTRLPGGAAGAATGAPLVRPTRSSRTKVSPPQASNARNR